MVEVKVGDKFARHHDWSGRILETRTVVKVSDKSIWFEDAGKNTYRVKNTGSEYYYMPWLKDSKLKDCYSLVKE